MGRVSVTQRPYEITSQCFEHWTLLSSPGIVTDDSGEVNLAP